MSNAQCVYDIVTVREMVLFQNKVNIRSDQKITCNQIYITTAQMLRKNVSLKIEYNFYDEYKYFGQDTLRCN